MELLPQPPNHPDILEEWHADPWQVHVLSAFAGLRRIKIGRCGPGEPYAMAYISPVIDSYLEDNMRLGMNLVRAVFRRLDNTATPAEMEDALWDCFGWLTNGERYSKLRLDELLAGDPPRW